MSSSTTVIGDRRRQALERASAIRRHPARRAPIRPARASTPPPVAFYLIAVVIAVFVMLGLVMVLSASSITEFHKGNSPWRLFMRQSVWAALGVVGLWVALRVPLHFWRRMVVPVTTAAFGFMLLPFVPGFKNTVDGASSWASVGGLSVQPSEFLKLAVLLFCADLLSKRHAEMNDLRRTLVPVLVVAMGASGLCLLQGDMGSAIVLAGIVFVMAFIGGAPFLPMAGAGALGAVGMLGFVFSSPRRMARFTAFMDIAGHKDTLSYQTYQATIAVAQGGITGQGPARGSALLGEFLPLAHSDFIFAVIAQELGLIGVIGVLGGFLVLVYSGVQVALSSTHDRFAALVASGIVGWLVVQTTINVGGVVGLMPVTGLTLPFFSAGGSSLFVMMTAGGLLLNVARNGR
ncbi:MAG: putative peptidoglycan glycosyltransferase FtsW [Ilumatobacteraceae bacterium]